MANKKEAKKLKILTLGDNPLLASGVGIMSRLMIEGLLKTGKYSFISIGGMVNPPETKPIKTEEYGDDWVILPNNGYGSHDLIRSLLRMEKPDILWFMTDPRYWEWLFDIENEIRPLCPMVYYNIWDSPPTPMFNKKFYESCDVLVPISKVTKKINEEVAPNTEVVEIPHTADYDIFKRLSKREIESFKVNSLGEKNKDKFVFFFNSRNARRKHSGTLIWWFKDVLEEIGKDSACLVLHTNPKDDHGPDLDAVIKDRGLTNGEVMISPNKIPTEQLVSLYNLADCTALISDAEGWGLALVESLACETPIICTMTGGMQQQVTDGEGNWFGIGIEPSSQMVVGSQQVPYIYEDRIAKEDFVAACVKMYNMSKKDREDMGKAGREFVVREYGFADYTEKWDKLFEKIHKERGSWPTRGYDTRYELKETE